MHSLLGVEAAVSTWLLLVEFLDLLVSFLTARIELAGSSQSLSTASTPTVVLQTTLDEAASLPVKFLPFKIIYIVF
jgi:hypothetical protein